MYSYNQRHYLVGLADRMRQRQWHRPVSYVLVLVLWGVVLMLSFFLLQNPRHGLTESVPLLLQISSGPHAPVQQAGRRRRAPAEVRPRDGHAVRPQSLLGRPHATLRPGRPRSGKSRGEKRLRTASQQSLTKTFHFKEPYHARARWIKDNWLS